MGLFSKIREFGGGVPAELMQHGLLARGQIVDIQITGVSTGGDVATSQKQVCVFTVDVMLDNEDPFRATVRQGVPALLLPQLNGAVVAVRVDPQDHQEIALDLDSEPPVVTLRAGRPNTSSAAVLLATGQPARAVIIQSQALGMRNASGVDMYAFVFTVFLEGHPPYQATVGNPVPDAAKPLLFPGANLPARVNAAVQNEVVVDWEAALTEASHVPATPPSSQPA
jgi:hypothetical protein